MPGASSGTSILRGPRRDVPFSACQLVERTAAAHPASIAVRHGRDLLTYRELVDRAARLAAVLHRRGLRAGEAVAVHLRPGLDSAVAALAVLCAGGAYLPIDPALPLRRRQLMATVGGARIVLVAGGAAESWEPAETIALDDPAVTAVEPVTGVAHRPGRAAYVLFTSGSTGTPKGVVMPGASLANLVSWQTRTSVAGPGSRTLQFAPSTFDVSVQEMMSTWATGGELVVLDADRRRDPEAIIAVCADLDVARVFLPFAALGSLAGWAAATGRRLPALCEIITAGEQPLVTPAVEGFIRRCHPEVVLVNQYGPTETHVVTHETLSGPAGHWPRVPPMGLPVDNCDIALLDGDEVVPDGAEGEICVAGVPVGIGYLGASPADTGRFGPLPALGGRWGYRTGDLARVQDGRLRFLGRADRQVKVAGQRIELGEIEVLAAHVPAVAEAVAVPGDTAGAGITLFLVPAERSRVDTGEVRRTLADNLPAPVVPSRIEVVDVLPLTSSGKVDRTALTGRTVLTGRPALAVTGGGADDVTARIARVLADVLGGGPVRPGDSFVGLGGSSLQAMSALARFAAEFSRTPGVEGLLGGRTVADLAVDLEAGRWRPVTSAIPPGGAGGERFASAVQEEFWVAGMGPHGSTPLNLVVALDVDGRVDAGRLREALRGTVEAHDELRSTLYPGERRLMIRLLENVDPELSIMSVTGDVEREAVTRAFADRPFTVETDLPVRAALVSGPAGDRILLAVHHHVADDEGFHAFVDEVAARYTAGPDVTVPAPAVVVVDDPAALPYWAGTLAGVGSAAVTWLQGAGGAPSGRFTRLVAEPGSASLRRAPGATLFAGRLASFLHAARSVGAPEEVLVGTVVSRRPAPGVVDGSMGCHITLLPLRLTVAATWERTAAGVQETLTAALAHRQVAFSSIARFLPPAPRAPMVTFGAERQEGRAVRIGPATSRLRFVAPGVGQFPFMATVEGDGPSTAFRLVFDDGLYPADVVGRLLKRWC
ncbi:AMP-binding protein [Actinoplanes subglobosus]|uniref:AMP-binding protein n=1 Tax=Actinoplanes subglobosus TaxID=1547892 RepID=A0ABV8IPU3_9ACTN